jgi:ABC-type bacteriocin/lantibiotic exporter with double-glycine peptidase domain
MQAMQRLMQGRTTFMISHRPSTLVSCDAWLQIEGGGLIDAIGLRTPLDGTAHAFAGRAAGG